MVYLTSDAQKNAQALGINEDDERKLYNVAKAMNRFLKAVEKNGIREMEERGGSKDEEYEYDDTSEREM